MSLKELIKKMQNFDLNNPEQFESISAEFEALLNESKINDIDFSKIKEDKYCFINFSALLTNI